jgi:hypothetical protein
MLRSMPMIVPLAAALAGACGSNTDTGPVVDPVTRAFLQVDPAGDTLVLAGFPSTVPAVDLVAFQGDFKGDSLILTLAFTGPVVGATVGASNSIQGEIEFDLDDNPGTGAAPFSDAFGASSNLGIDCYVDLFHSTPTGVAVTNFTTGVTTEAVAKYAGNTMIIRIPMSALGGDDGNFDVVGIVGVLERPTDVVPNSGFVAVHRSGSLVQASRHQAGRRPEIRRLWAAPDAAPR